MNVGTDESSRLREVEGIYRTRFAELQRVAAAISGSRQAAPDLVQEAFVRAVQRIDTFRGDGPLDGWVWRIVVNVAKGGRSAPLGLVRPEQESAVVMSSGALAHADLAAAVAKLSERQRLVLFLRYYADLDYATIAEALSISSGTVGATLTTARTALEQALEVKEATS
jgi:RNA polymerase sigma-70 factor, ECF subfamily